jgi:diaminopropionate ammonia-lyase
MACLACGEPSFLAWQELERAAFGLFPFRTRRRWPPCGRCTSASRGSPPGIARWRAGAPAAGRRATPSGRTALELGEDSRVLVIGTEGATDPALLHAKLVGRGD